MRVGFCLFVCLVFFSSSSSLLFGAESLTLTLRMSRCGWFLFNEVFSLFLRCFLLYLLVFYISGSLSFALFGTFSIAHTFVWFLLEIFSCYIINWPRQPNDTHWPHQTFLYFILLLKNQISTETLKIFHSQYILLQFLSYINWNICPASPPWTHKRQHQIITIKFLISKVMQKFVKNNNNKFHHLHVHLLPIQRRSQNKQTKKPPVINIKHK